MVAQQDYQTSPNLFLMVVSSTLGHVWQLFVSSFLFSSALFWEQKQGIGLRKQALLWFFYEWLCKLDCSKWQKGRAIKGYGQQNFFYYLMQICRISWSRDLYNPSKRLTIRNIKWKGDFLCLQESKLYLFSLEVIRSMSSACWVY